MAKRVLRGRPAEEPSAIARLWYASPLYRLTLIARPPRRLARLPPDPWPGDAARGAGILSGRFTCAGQAINAEHPDWRSLDLRSAALAELNAFGWLDDLAAEASEAAQQRARHLVGDWLDAGQGWDRIAWAPDVLGARVAAWLGHARFLSRGNGDPLGPRLLASLTRQFRHLRRVAGGGTPGLARLVALKGLVYGSLVGVAPQTYLAAALRLLERELALQVLPDGGHIERSPSVHLRALEALSDIRGMLVGAGRSVPVALETAIERMAPMLRSLRHGDGGLALFNDSNEENPALVDVVLARANARARPANEARDTGFHRLTAERVLVVVDAGAPPPRGFDKHAHAGTLSFEMSVGKERLIVNCGAHPSSDPAWRKAQRYSAANSTLVVGDTNSSEVEDDGGFDRRPRRVECVREEADGNVWLAMSHDGYEASLGLIHRRRIYLSHDGADLRGEDTVAGRYDGAYAIRFHLHPDVQASVIQNGAAALLRLPSGIAWRLQAAGGGLELAESVYLGKRGEMRRGEQIVIAGPLADDSTTIKWALKRVPKA